MNRKSDTMPNNAQKHAEYLQQKTDSNYRSDKESEVSRLRVQSKYSEQIDRESIEYALHAIRNVPYHLTALDVGCADGYVTESRFSDYDWMFDMVVGIDHNKNMIARQHDHDMFCYRHINVEALDFEEQMDNMMKELGIDGFDIIFSALTIHHLAEPVEFLKKIQRYLKKGGALILRGVDDGALLTYGDAGLAEDVIEMSIMTKNMSDRFHGRKFYSMLREAGFDKVKMKYEVADSVGASREEREALFNYYFQFRSDYTKRQLDSNPQDVAYQMMHKEMCDQLQELHKSFLDPDFYFMVMTISAIATIN